MKKIAFSFLLFINFFLFKNSSCEKIPKSEWLLLNDQNITEDSSEFWLNVSSQFLNLSQNWGERKYAEWQNSKQIITPGVISEQCLNIIDHILLNLISSDQWTAKVVDSMGGIPAGILSMSHTSLGDFDECLSISNIFENSSFVGKYCLATLSIPRQSYFKRIAFNHTELPVKWFGKFIDQWYDNDNFFYSTTAVCFPSICKPEEIKIAIEAHFPIVKNFDFNVTFCQSSEEPSQPDSRIWIGIAIIAIPWCFIVFGTIMELLCSQKPVSFFGKFIHLFSIITNLKFLFHISNNSHKNEEFQFVHGIRAFASIFIVMAHAAGFIYVQQQFQISPFARYPGDIIEMGKTLHAQPFYAGSLMVIVFFIMSGMFLARGTLVKGRLRINFFSYVALRWLRFTPSLVGLIGLTYVAELFGSGPLFHHDLIWPTVRGCYEDWIENLLYISNYINLQKMCNVQLWYLSSEMQMHILAFVLILIYVRSSRLTYLISCLFILIGIVGVITISGFGFVKYNIIQIIHYPENLPPIKLARYGFFNPIMNMISYYLGFILGIILLEKRPDRLSQNTVRIIWIFAIFILLSTPFANYFKAQDPQAQWNRNAWHVGLEVALGLLAWSAAVTWTMWRFILYPKNAVARMLAAKFWQPISRLSFSIYLSHILVIWYNVYQIRNTISLGDKTQVFKMTSVAIIESYALGLFIYVTFEAPSMNFLRLLMPTKNSRKDPESTESLHEMKLDKNLNFHENLTD